jgi:hypothetical protein
MPKHCIFCGGRPLTKEHFWGKWSREITLNPFPHTRHVLQRYDDGQLRRTRGHGDRPGSVRSQSLKVVCRECNEGWMSAIQQDAKPILTKLNYGQWPKLDEIEQRRLSEWLVLFLMTSEFRDLTTAVINQDERNQFYRDRSLGQNWIIGIGLYQDIPNSDSSIHHAVRTDDQGFFSYSKIFLLRFGRFLAVVIWDQKEITNLVLDGLRNLPFRQILPTASSELQRPLLYFDRNSEQIVIDTLFNALSGWWYTPIYPR